MGSNKTSTKSNTNANTTGQLSNLKKLVPTSRVATSRDRRPSDKVAAQLEAQHAAKKLKAEQAERRALREKKALQKANQQAGIENDGEDEFEPRDEPTFTSHEVVTKVTLGQRGGKVPPARTATSSLQSVDPDEVELPNPPRRHIHQPRQSSPRAAPHPPNEMDEEELPNPPRRHVHRPRLQPSPAPSPPNEVDEEESPPIEVDEDDEVQHMQSPHHHSHGPQHRDPSSQSPSPQAGSKRQRNHDIDEDSDQNDSDLEEEADVHVSKTAKKNKTSSRPKAGDYDEIGRELVLGAANIYRALLASQGAFPSPSKELELVKKSWKLANDESGVNTFALTPSIVTIIKCRGSQLRGEAKAKTSSLVEALYGFDSGRSKKAIAENRRIAEELKADKGFVFAVLSDDEDGKRKGIYNHPIIQKAVNKMWFKNKRGEGVLNTDYFKPIPVPAIALILTAIECNIEEWATGVKTDLTFWSEEYRPIYDSHVVSLFAFGDYSKSKNLDLLGRLQRKLYNFGRVHAGISTVEPHQSRHAIPMAAFAEAVEEYEADDVTDDEGCMMNA